ncbi:MAG: hypothetical protein WD095_00780 [Candidatus Paceibacterota bacterium]
MNLVNKILSISVLFFLALIIQESLILELGFTNLNLLLLGFVFLVYFLENKEFFLTFSIVSMFLLLFSVFWLPFWIIDIAMLVVAGLVSYFIFKNISTGNDLLNFNLLILSFMFVFYLALVLIGSVSVNLGMIISLIIYNFFIGNIIFYFLTDN